MVWNNEKNVNHSINSCMLRIQLKIKGGKELANINGHCKRNRVSHTSYLNAAYSPARDEHPLSRDDKLQSGTRHTNRDRNEGGREYLVTLRLFIILLREISWFLWSSCSCCLAALTCIDKTCAGWSAPASIIRQREKKVADKVTQCWWNGMCKVRFKA